MKSHLYKITDICQSYKIEITFIYELHAHGLIEIHRKDEYEFLAPDQLVKIEKYHTWHHELDLNYPALAVVEQLINKVESLQEEVKKLKSTTREKQI